MKKTGSRKSVKRKWRLFSVMIVHVGAGRLFVFFFPVKVIWLIISGSPWRVVRGVVRRVVRGSGVSLFYFPD